MQRRLIYLALDGRSRWQIYGEVLGSWHCLQQASWEWESSLSSVHIFGAAALDLTLSGKDS
jgi:hypothetical protein